MKVKINNQHQIENIYCIFMYNIYVYILSINALYSVVSPGDQRNLVTISHFTFKITSFSS